LAFANVQQATIKPLIKATIAPGSLIYADEYAIYTPSPSGVMSIKRCVMVEASMRALEERDGFVRYMSHDGGIMERCCALVTIPSRHLSRQVTFVWL